MYVLYVLCITWVSLNTYCIVLLHVGLNHNAVRMQLETLLLNPGLNPAMVTVSTYQSPTYIISRVPNIPIFSNIPYILIAIPLFCILKNILFFSPVIFEVSSDSSYKIIYAEVYKLMTTCGWRSDCGVV